MQETKEFIVVWQKSDKITYAAAEGLKGTQTKKIEEAKIFFYENEALTYRFSPSYYVAERTAHLRSLAAKMEKNATDFESRICFGIIWFKTEEEAIEYGKLTNLLGITYNGGFFHGMPCGRDKTWDNEKDGFASTR